MDNIMYKKIGFLKSDKDNEKRICIFPSDIKNIKYSQNIFIEKGYGKNFYIDDNEYEKLGCKIKNQNDILNECDVIVDPKIGDAKYLNKINNKIIFGWIHAVQNKNITDILLQNNNTVFAWEEMFNDARHIFWKNNEIAGEASVLDALLKFGILPLNSKIAILGNGNTGRGAYKVLTQLGANPIVYSRKMEKNFKKEMFDYDIIINCVLWDVNRKDHIIYEKDINKFKKGTLIIDISCDNNGAIEFGKTTTMEKPIIDYGRIAYYAVDHTPSLLYKTVSIELSKNIVKYINEFIENNYSIELLNAKIIEKGKIIDEKISIYQNRNV